MNVRRRAHGGEAEERSLEWPGNPDTLTAESVDFEALAHVLANTCRRDGRMRRFHSLAAHAVTMSEAIEGLGGDMREAALQALLFEASVAWLGPDAAPSRRKTEKLRRLGARVDRAVREAAGLESEPTPEQAELLRFIARMADAAEARDVPGSGDSAAAILFPPLDRKIKSLDPARAARLWLDRLNDLKRPPDSGGSTAESGTKESGAKDHMTGQENPHDTHVRKTQIPAGGSRDAA
ncbi:MAG: hypothetical protein OXE44_17360 [Nitrospinae bacterium]|nr:hypothetical protein [Nitrospinota bacterium]